MRRLLCCNDDEQQGDEEGILAHDLREEVARFFQMIDVDSDGSITGAEYGASLDLALHIVSRTGKQIDHELSPKERLHAVEADEAERKIHQVRAIFDAAWLAGGTESTALTVDDMLDVFGKSELATDGENVDSNAEAARAENNLRNKESFAFVTDILSASAGKTTGDKAALFPGLSLLLILVLLAWIPTLHMYGFRGPSCADLMCENNAYNELSWHPKITVLHGTRRCDNVQNVTPELYSDLQDLCYPRIVWDAENGTFVYNETSLKDNCDENIFGSVGDCTKPERGAAPVLLDLPTALVWIGMLWGLHALWLLGCLSTKRSRSLFQKIVLLQNDDRMVRHAWVISHTLMVCLLSLTMLTPHDGNIFTPPNMEQGQLILNQFTLSQAFLNIRGMRAASSPTVERGYYCAREEKLLKDFPIDCKYHAHFQTAHDLWTHLHAQATPSQESSSLMNKRVRLGLLCVMTINSLGGVVTNPWIALGQRPGDYICFAMIIAANVGYAVYLGDMFTEMIQLFQMKKAMMEALTAMLSPVEAVKARVPYLTLTDRDNAKAWLAMRLGATKWFLLTDIHRSEALLAGLFIVEVFAVIGIVFCMLADRVALLWFCMIFTITCMAFVLAPLYSLLQLNLMVTKQVVAIHDSKVAEQLRGTRAERELDFLDVRAACSFLYGCIDKSMTNLRLQSGSHSQTPATRQAGQAFWNPNQREDCADATRVRGAWSHRRCQDDR
eukprot:COSAG04_NODE_102_length_26175_cov_14.250163_4_plen_726_part_00